MRLKNLLNDQKREILVSRMLKRLRGFLSPSPGNPVPIFIMGTQRSGTTMLMNAMHLNAHTQVFDESRNNRVFYDFRLRDIETVIHAIRHSKAPFVLFKPLADSHLTRTYLDLLPEARFIWVYRHYKDVAYSAIRKWKSADDAIRKVCRGQGGGGWFQEGISVATERVLRKYYNDCLNRFELRCLVWWARNNLYMEQALSTDPNVMLVQYEDIARDPMAALTPVSHFTGLPLSGKMFRYIHTRSIGNKVYPPINEGIKQLCEAQLNRLDGFYDKERQQFRHHRLVA
jgi:hypothetical protein